MSKLTAAQKKAWELIKSELALSDEERQKNGIFSSPWGKPGIFTLIDRKRIITMKTWRALQQAGLIEITDTWTARCRFRLTDAGQAEMDVPAAKTVECQVEVVYEDNSYRHFRGEYSAASARFLVNDNRPAAIKWWVMTRFSDGVKLVQYGSW